MTRSLPKLPYLQIVRAGGRPYGYYRRGVLRARIKGEPGDAAFLAHYAALHAQAEAAASATRAAPPATPAAGTLGALITAFKASPDWLAVRDSTRAEYTRVTSQLQADYGHCLVRTLDRSHVFGIRDKYAIAAAPDGTQRLTPWRANKAIAVLSLVLSWGVDHGWRPDNPALRPKRLATGDGHRAWTPAEIATGLEGAAWFRLALLLALCTGQREADLIALRWSAFDGRGITLRQAKTEEGLWIPCHRELLAALHAAPKSALTILTSPRGRPWTRDNFAHAVGEERDRLGIAREAKWHGLRHTCGAWLSEAGCSSAEVQAILGHRTLKMVEKYTKGAAQKRQASAAIRKLNRRRIGTAGERGL